MTKVAKISGTVISHNLSISGKCTDSSGTLTILVCIPEKDMKNEIQPANILNILIYTWCHILNIQVVVTNIINKKEYIYQWMIKS